jgi:hypothetical protein
VPYHLATPQYFDFTSSNDDLQLLSSIAGAIVQRNGVVVNGFSQKKSFSLFLLTGNFASESGDTSNKE